MGRYVVLVKEHGRWELSHLRVNLEGAFKDIADIARQAYLYDEGNGNSAIVVAEEDYDHGRIRPIKMPKALLKKLREKKAEPLKPEAVELPKEKPVVREECSIPQPSASLLAWLKG